MNRLSPPRLPRGIISCTSYFATTFCLTSQGQSLVDLFLKRTHYFAEQYWEIESALAPGSGRLLSFDFVQCDDNLDEIICFDPAYFCSADSLAFKAVHSVRNDLLRDISA